MNLSTEQLQSLSTLFMDLSKGLFVAALAGPAISSIINLSVSVRCFVLGVMFVYWSLKLLDLKEIK